MTPQGRRYRYIYNETMDFDVEAEDVRGFIRTNDKSITKYLDKAKEALEAELKKR